MTKAPNRVKREGWILYDDSCGLCRKWVPFWEATLRGRGFEIAPLQSDWVCQRLGSEGLLDDLTLLFEDGRHIRGPNVYRFAMSRIWWARPLSILASMPILRRVFDWGYRTFAANRHRLSRACRIDERDA